MNSPVRDAIAAELAELTQEQPYPVAPFGWGRDLNCASDLLETMGEVDPFSTLALGQAIVRRLDCPRGALPDDLDYGIDLRAYLNRGTAAAEIAQLATRIRTEITKDDRIDSAVVTVTPSPSGSSLGVAIRVTPVDAQIGGFSMTLAVTSAEVLVQEISR